MPFYGETTCSHKYQSGKRKGNSCTNQAYYESNGQYVCGVHSKKGERTKLEINPKKEEIEQKRLEDEKAMIEQVALENRKNKQKGKVVCSKLRMMKKPDNIEGYMKVFPNFKHQTRRDGFGCASLSPKSLGPVDHGMPGYPSAKNIENFHQFSKIFEFELEDLEKAKQLRIDAYKSDKPHRHKYPTEQLKKYNKNVNIPLYSVYVDKYGNEHQYNYVQCRYFYCHWYEKLAKETQDFKQLETMINNGYNLQIIGYDGYQPTNDLYSHYLDESRPFGHELVLYTLLTVKNPKEYPWNLYYSKYNDIYKNII